jgi:hypothetical protein
MKLHIPPPILMLLSATLMWALCRWLPMAHWIERPWNRLQCLQCWHGGVCTAGELTSSCAPRCAARIRYS